MANLKPFLMLMIIPILFASGCIQQNSQHTAGNNERGNIYSNESLGFEVKIPNNWEIKRVSPDRIKIASGLYPWIADGPPENNFVYTELEIVTFSKPIYMTTEEYFRGEPTNATLVDGIAWSADGHFTQVSGEKAWERTVIVKQGAWGDYREGHEIFIIHNGKRYLISLMVLGMDPEAVKRASKEIQPDFNTLVQSFKFLK